MIAGLLDHVKPAAREKADVLIIHIGRNDNGEDLNTIKKVKKLVTVIKEIDKGNDIEIAFSGIIHREDLLDTKEMIDDTNKKLKSYCASLGIGFINNANIDGSCLSRCE